MRHFFIEQSCALARHCFFEFLERKKVGIRFIRLAKKANAAGRVFPSVAAIFFTLSLVSAAAFTRLFQIDDIIEYISILLERYFIQAACCANFHYAAS